MLPSFFKKEAKAISFLGRVLPTKLGWELSSLCPLLALHFSSPHGRCRVVTQRPKPAGVRAWSFDPVRNPQGS